MSANEETSMIYFQIAWLPMRRCVTRRRVVIHAAWQLKTMDLESIFKTGKKTEISGEMVSLHYIDQLQKDTI